jgi:transposase
MTILGLDLGKFKSVACSYDPGTHDTSFTTVPTDPDAIRGLLATGRPDLVAFETCTVAGWVADTCAELKLPYLVANPMGEAWRWSRVKRKTDRDDALKLARMAALGQLPTVHVPSPEARQYRGLVAYRTRLVGRRTAVQNRLRALAQAHGLLLPRGHRAWTREGLAALRAIGQPPESCPPEQLWRAEFAIECDGLEALLGQIGRVEQLLDAAGQSNSRVRLLETIPGVGRRTAEVIAAYLDDPHRFRTAGEVSAYAGLVPRQFQSGETDRKGRITKRGPRLLRKALVEAAWVMQRYNPWAARTFERLSRGQRGRRKAALVGVARKLLVRSWAMLRSDEPWKGEEVAMA